MTNTSIPQKAHLSRSKSTMQLSPSCSTLSVSCLLLLLLLSQSIDPTHSLSLPSSFPDGTSRRQALQKASIIAGSSSTTAAVVSSVWIGAFPGNAEAATPTTPAEAIRRSAANLPGYGDSDVFYPRTMQGKWKATREELVGNNNKNSSGADPTVVPPVVVEYEMRFLPSVLDNAVVADRGFNKAALESVLHPSNPVQTFQWTETNPNDLRIVYADNTKQEIKVTKRATEVTNETVSSSEFVRITTEDGVRGIPSIGARRILSKWRVVSDSVVEGIQIVYDVGGNLGDPLSMGLGGGGGPGSSGPQVVSKVRLHLERIQ